MLCGLAACWGTVVLLSTAARETLLAPLALAAQTDTEEEEEDAPAAPDGTPAGGGRASGATPLDALEEEEEPPPPEQGTSKNSRPGKAATSLDEQEEEEEEEEQEDGPPPPSTGNSSATPLDSSEEEEDDGKSSAKTTAADTKAEATAAILEQATDVYDLLVYRSGRKQKLGLLKYPWRRPKENKKVSFPAYSKSPDAEGLIHVKVDDVDGVMYYEQRMLSQAASMLSVKKELLAQPCRPVPYSAKVKDRVELAEKLLAAALAEHLSAVQRGRRLGDAWHSRCRDPLIWGLMNIRLGRLDAMIKQASPTAVSEWDRLRSIVEADPVLRNHTELAGHMRLRIERCFLPQAREAISSQDFEKAHKLLQELDRRNVVEPGSEAYRLREQMESLASDMLNEAKRLKHSEPNRARELLRQARAAWPAHPDLRILAREVEEAYPILRVAYPELPRTFLPFAASRPVERHASALLFERLVRLAYDELAGWHYEPQLAVGRPMPLKRGRTFRLPRCRWSDATGGPADYRLLPQDVAWTVTLMKNPELPCYAATWASLVKDVQTGRGEVSILLKADYWQPLALMDFAILPRHAFDENASPEELKQQLRELAERPVGTGPYVLDVEARAEDEIRFVANPNYRQAGKPRVREIVMRRYADAVAAVRDFEQGELDLIYGISPEHVAELERNHKIVALRGPSVWFLAPNYRKLAMQNSNLRLALAHAIDREAVLSQHFRPPGHDKDHTPLYGPFPADCWAAKPGTTPFGARDARTFADRARSELGNLLTTLELVYPTDDPAVENACKAIQQQAAENAGLDIELVPVPSFEYYDRVVFSHRFDLAWWRHDFEDVTFWLGPLLDPAEIPPGGDNLLGYRPDAEASRLLQDLKKHKRFLHVRATTHGLHDHMQQFAIVIPLWQLHVYVAVGPKVLHAELDPISLFGRIEDWQLKL